MAPHNGLVHLKEYDIKDSNVELIGSDLDHKVKHASAEAEPAWNDGHVGLTPGLVIWRIENFAVVPLPKSLYGQFHSGDSYIILHSQPTTSKPPKLIHDIYFYRKSKSELFMSPSRYLGSSCLAHLPASLRVLLHPQTKQETKTSY